MDIYLRHFDIDSCQHSQQHDANMMLSSSQTCNFYSYDVVRFSKLHVATIVITNNTGSHIRDVLYANMIIVRIL
jgi:hypothetical protein